MEENTRSVEHIRKINWINWINLIIIIMFILTIFLFVYMILIYGDLKIEYMKCINNSSFYYGSNIEKIINITE